MPQNPNDTARPWRFPAFRLLALTLALIACWLSVKSWLSSGTVVEKFYFWSYVRLSALPNLTKAHFSIGQGLKSAPTFDVLFIGPTVATSRNFRTLHGPSTTRQLPMESQSFYDWLRINIYGNRSLLRLLQTPLYLCAILIILSFVVGLFFDKRQSRKSRKGKLLRGPALMNRWKFNRKTRGDGLAFRLQNRRNLFELFMPGDSGKYLRIRRDREAHHIQIAGDTGSGKSTLIRSILYQIEARDREVAIVFDPDREYIQEFFREERGDWVLNPKDNRCPYWPIGNECTDEADATPVANGFFPDDPTLQKFFLSHTRAIFAYLLARYKPTVNELAFWMAHPEEIDKRVQGTEHEHTLTVNAAPQRAGIFGSLNEAGKPLRMMPTASEGRRVWTAKKWAEERKGWIFITSTPETIDALRPVQSLWLDMLILKLQTSARLPEQNRVWMVLDELASLNALPKLHSALTKQRKSDNPIVIGFQGMSQIDALYPKKSETILSQAFTNIVLRTREPRGAEHLSKLIGKAQLERLRENKPARWFQWKQGSYTSERVVDSVVMESEIQGLDDLNGYFVQKDRIVNIRFSPFAKRILAAGLVERVIPTGDSRPTEAPAPAQPVPIATIEAQSQMTSQRRMRKAKEQVLKVPAHIPAPELSEEQLPLVNSGIDIFQ